MSNEFLLDPITQSSSIINIIMIKDPLTKSSSNSYKGNIDGVPFTANNAKLLGSTRISVTIDGSIYEYSRTYSYKTTTYFHCINRKKSESTGKKCLAKIHYYSSDGELEIISLHIQGCMNDKLVQVDCDYNTQKHEILGALQEDTGLTVVEALDLLRKKNVNAPENKKLPLAYDQVKTIIRNFREDNKINSVSTLSNASLLKTTDNAIFRRCHNKSDYFYKSKLFFLPHII
jgi:hypothetical protein